MVTNTRARIALLALGLSAWTSAPALAGADPSAPGSATEATRDAPRGVIEVFRSRHHCLSAADHLTLRRPDANGPSMVTLRHTGSGANAKITWDADATLTDWPADLPVEDGDTLHVLVAGSPASNRVTVHIVPGQMTSPAQVAVWMAQMGCSAQARLLLARL